MSINHNFAYLIAIFIFQGHPPDTIAIIYFWKSKLNRIVEINIF